MTQPDADPMVGRTVAHYEIVARLGGGGMGVVYHAHDRKLGRSVALKFLPQQWSHDAGAKQRFLREAQAASATAHPNICTIHDIATADDGQLFIVMAHYRGGTLKKRLEDGPLPIEEALDIATQVADGLARAHAQGVVHRDIKPGNLILTEDGVRIVDFGLATFVDALQLTVEGSTLGTAAYMSPEQVRGQDVDTRSDVWAVGVVLYQMLAGDTPFRGTYAEAIGHAIRNEPPPALRAQRAGIPEEVEQLVFRALHKDPAIRFQHGRELARALRQVRGLTVPVDLRTTAVVVPLGVKAPARLSRRTRTAAALAIVLLLAGAPALMLMPVARVAVAVTPVANENGAAELHEFRLALTQAIVRQLADSRLVRVTPYERLLQIMRPFRAAPKDPSSNEAVNAIAKHSGAAVLIVPTILYVDGAWRIRVDYQDAVSRASLGSDEVTSEVTVLRNAAVYGLTLPLAERIRDHFTNTAPWRAYLAERVRPLFGADSHGAVRMQTLEAASLFEQGVDFYEQQEHDDARSLFERAAAADPKNPLLHAWHARVASLLRSDEEATAAAQRAVELLTRDTPRLDRLFVEASAAEAGGDAAAADAAYAGLAAAFRDEPAWIIERAGFEDRQFRNQDAITSYHAALAADPRLVRPHLELCRMYGPGRANLPANAETEGRLALARYQELGARAGEVQARWCLIDVLRVGGAEQVNEARILADGALAIVESLGYDYNLSRALNYVALAAAAQGSAPEAIAFWERSLDVAERTGNRPLQPLALMNLGVANQRLGNVARALEYRRRSAAGFERLGQQQRAAQLQANAAQLVIDYGGDAPNLLRDIDNALAVFQRYRDRDFEVFALHLRAAYYRNAGRYDAAERDLVQATSIAQQHDLHENRVRVLLDYARLKFELGNYAEARKALADATAVDAGPNAPEIAVLLGRIHGRLDEYDAAHAQFEAAAEAIGKGRTASVTPLVHFAQGELEFRRRNLAAARTHFERAVSLGNSMFRDEVTIESAAYRGLIDALTGDAAGGRRALMASLEDAARLPRYALEAKCRLLLARVDIAQRRFADAGRTLAAIPDDGARSVGGDLRTEIESARQAIAATAVGATGQTSVTGRIRVQTPVHGLSRLRLGPYVRTKRFRR